MRWLCQVIKHEAIDNNSGIGSMGVSLVSIHKIIRIKTRVVDHQIKKTTHHEQKINFDIKPVGVDDHYYEKITSCICSFRLQRRAL